MTMKHITHVRLTVSIAGCILLLASVTGCSTPRYRLHAKPNALPSQVALLKSPGMAFGVAALIREVDGKPGPTRHATKYM